MTDYRLIGLESIAIGTCRSGPGMTTTLTSIGAIIPDSAFLALEKPSKTGFPVEDSDFDDIVVYTPGQKFAEFATQDLGPANMVLALGGTNGGTNWKAPNDATVVTEKSVRMISKTYNGKKATIDIVHAAVCGGADLQLSKTKQGTLGFRVDILRPKALATDVPIKVTWS